MNDGAEPGGRTRSGDRGERVASRGAETAGPEDVQDTWNTTQKTWDREQSPVDVFEKFDDEDINEELIGREPRRSGI